MIGGSFLSNTLRAIAHNGEAVSASLSLGSKLYRVGGFARQSTEISFELDPGGENISW